MAPDLYQLLDSLDPTGDRVQRNLWMMRLLQWVRGSAVDAAQAAGRVELLLDALQSRPDRVAQVRALWSAVLREADVSIVLSDYGLPSRAAFMGELVERLQRKWLPASPDTGDGGEVFAQLFSSAFDPLWLNALSPATVQRLAQLLHMPVQTLGRDLQHSHWREAQAQAIAFCTSHIRAIGFSPEVRARLPQAVREDNPFLHLSTDWESTLRAWHDGVDHRPALTQFQGRLEACRKAAQEVLAHLEENGISVDLVFRLRQLRERTVRIRLLLDCLFDDAQHQRSVALVRQLCLYGQAQRSVRALVAANSSLLAAKVAERSSETGEHYITRNWAEYRGMLRQSAGGGAMLSLTTGLKFGVMALGFSAFWYGFWAGLLYALSFVLIQLLHFTVATKQPAMTAPAMAARLKDMDGPGSADAFADEVEHLVRSQVAAVVGNVSLVIPCALLLCLGWWWATGSMPISVDTAHYVLHSLNLMGPSALFAAFTGVLLFSSSILAGWAENWFVLHRLESAIRHNPRITAVLGPARAERWAHFLRQNISGFAANISLGLMLGMVPPVLQFLALGLDVRHVTLSAGQLSMALATLGLQAFSLPAFWWALAALPVLGALNIGVSFLLAFRVALRAQDVTVQDRRRLYQTLRARMRHQPLRFFLPASEPRP